jgi:putative endonuclease
MAVHNELGKYGEELAKVYLLEKEFEILFLNWKYSYYEIDVIAIKKNILHFIEIKTRRNLKYGFPEEGVDKKKLENLLNAGEAFMYQFPCWQQVQYDILSIYINKNNAPEYFFIEDVYV